ncbi:uncharacterized protein LOC143375815 [Andrena cerasifolii]|uniref:uncharacterized protein LOC143375815 n=1 Tax=Andrena cerasifolii TaxID=2819439 RepID=UPI0040379243
MPKCLKKGNRSICERAANPRKRKFHGNRYTEQHTLLASTSSEKLKDSMYDDILVDLSHGYVIINFISVFTFISQHLQCKTCKSDVQFLRSHDGGLGFRLNIECHCGTKNIESSPLVNKAYEINRRIVFVMRLLGVGLQRLNLFCSMMDICHGLSNAAYYAVLQTLHCGAKSVFELVRDEACKEEIRRNTEEGNEPLHLSVSGDGSWKKRGFSSLFGVASLVGKYSNKVVDVVIKSAFCQSCANWKNTEDTPEYDEWKKSHAEDCTANHIGSAGKMEVDAVLEMFLRSEELHGVKYTNYIGDGGTKTFKAIVDKNPYEDVIVTKKECVGHVQKRMGTRLRAVKKAHAGIGGKGIGKLTNIMINKLTQYYGLAIRRNPNSAEDMKQAVWATYYHMSSTDANPHHEYCLKGQKSWCKWQRAAAVGELDSFQHPPPLNDMVLKAIRPVYEDLSSSNLLQRCTGGNTQNNNESFNACVWTLAPKHLHCGAQAVEIATYLAVCTFNNGYAPLLKLMNVLGLHVGPRAKMFAEDADRRRVAAAEHQDSLLYKKAKIAKKDTTEYQQQLFEETEGLLYGPGIAD